MTLIKTFTFPQGDVVRILVFSALTLFGIRSAHAQYHQLEESGVTFLADPNGSESYRIDLLSDPHWQGNECRLVSFLGGQLWSIDTPVDLQFTGTGSSLSSFGDSAIIDDSLGFTSAGFFTPGAWKDGVTKYLGVHREIEGVDYYGALAFRYNQDNSLSLLRFGIALGSFNTAQFGSLDPIPEPASAAVWLVAFGIACGSVRRLRGRVVTSLVVA